VAFGHFIRQQHAVAPVGEERGINQVRHLPHLTLAHATVRPITRSAAKQIVTLYEPMPAVSTAFYGLFVGDQLAAAVVFGPDPAANLCARYNGSTSALLRGACRPQRGLEADPWRHAFAAEAIHGGYRVQ
jgi:hypothetical protein